MDVVKDWIIANFGVTALVFIALLILAVYVGAWVARLRKDVENKPCESHRNAINEQTKRLEQDSALLHKMEGQLEGLTRLETGLQQVSTTLQMMAAGLNTTSSLTQSHNPISLTPKGKEIADELNLESALDQNWDKISSVIEDETNPYDIQMKFIYVFISDPDSYLDAKSMDRIKTNAFSNGIPLIDYMRMAGIIARDRYFKEHGIDINDVDKSEPVKKSSDADWETVL